VGLFTKTTTDELAIARATPKPEKKARVKLVGEDGNAFAILGRCVAAGKKAKYTPEQLKAFKDDATSGDYNHLLATCCEWFEVR
jgi:hypothetical protein